MRTASADDSRQTPARLLEITAASPTPAIAPVTVLMPRSTANSSTGSATEPSPLSTTPASDRASAAPTGSLKADSATIVSATFGRTRERTNSGIRMAGSVGASTAPSSSEAVSDRSNTRWATSPVTTAVASTPGRTSSPSPTQTLRSTCSDRLSPP